MRAMNPTSTTTAGPATAEADRPGPSSPMAPPSVSRRKFIAGGGVATLATLVLPSLRPRYAFATPNDPGAGDGLVVVFLRGGADGLSIVPPFSDSGYQTLRGSGTANDVAIPAERCRPGHRAIDLGATVNGHSFGLHPALAGRKGVHDAGHLAVVHAVGMPASESATRSPFASEANWERGSADPAVHGGWLARHLQAAGASDTLAAVAHDGSLPASLWGDHRAVAVPSIASFDVAGFWDVDPSRRALDLLCPTADPARGFGGGLRETAQLIRADVGLRVAVVEYNGWDFHDDMGPVAGGAMRAKAQGLSDALTAFHDDLGDLMGEVTVVVMSEFGRTIDVNGSGAADHGRGGAMMIMSGHAVGGVHGDYPSGRHGTTQEVFPGYTHPGDLGVLAV